MRVAVLSGGRSSEHEVSLRSGASVADGLREAGHEAVEVADRARRALASRRGAGRARARRGACWAATPPSRCCTAPAARTAASRGCSRCLGVPYVGLRRRGLGDLHRQARSSSALLALRRHSPGRLLRGGRARAGSEQAEAFGLPLWVKPARLGSSVGISRSRRPPGARRRRRGGAPPRPAGDRRGHRRPARRSSARCSATRSRSPRSPGEIVAQRPTGTTTRPSTREGGMDLVVPARDLRDGAPSGSASWPQRVFGLCGCSGLARCDFFVDGERRAGQRAQHDPRLHRDQRLREAARGRRDPLRRALRPARPARARAARATPVRTSSEPVFEQPDVADLSDLAARRPRRAAW